MSGKEELTEALLRHMDSLEQLADLARERSLKGVERTLLHVLSHLKALLDGLESGEPRF